MRLHFSYANGTPPFDFHTDTYQATPLELLVAGHGSPNSRQRALLAYVKSLDYLFRGVSNYASGDIVGVGVEKNSIGRMAKHNDGVDWTSIVDKSFMVVYDLSLQAITENMYVADAIAVNRKPGADGVNPIWIKELLTPQTKNDRVIKDNTITAISIITEYVHNYSLVFGLNGTDSLTIIDKNNKPVVIDNINNDEDFILVRLIMLILGKGMHHGVFLVDARGFSDRALKAFVEVARQFFGDTYIFMYNVPASCQVERVKVSLPNFFVTGNSVSR